MKKRIKAGLAFVASLCMVLLMMPLTVFAQQGNSVSLSVRVCEYKECEGAMDYVYVDQTELSATFTADDPAAVLDTNTTGGYTGILMDYIGQYERTFKLDEGYNRFCTVTLCGKLSKDPIAGKLTVSVPTGCDAATAKYSLYTEDESFNASTTPFTAVSAYTENTVTIPYNSVNGIADYILIEYVSTTSIPYCVVEGVNSTWTANSTDELAVRANGALDKFQSVKMDGAVVDASNYTATSGSTIITFKKEYLASLTHGTHSITIVFTDGEASTNVTIAGAASNKPSTEQPAATQKAPSQKDDVPKTGETAASMVWVILSVCGFVGMLSVYGYKNKKENE